MKITEIEQHVRKMTKLFENDNTHNLVKNVEILRSVKNIQKRRGMIQSSHSQENMSREPQTLKSLET